MVDKTQEEVDEGLQVEIEEDDGSKEVVIDDDGGEDASLEGKKRVDSEGDPNEDHPRFKKVYAKLKDAERKIETLETGNKDTNETMELMRTHNQTLVTAIEKQTKATEKIAESNEVSKENDLIKTIDTGIKTLNADKKEALENSDYDKVIDIDNQIMDLRDKKKEINEIPVATVEPSVSPTIPPEQQALIEKWAAEDADWYGKDPMMTSAAITVDSTIGNEPEWKGKPKGEMLKEIQRRVETRFNYKKANGSEPSEKTTGVSGVEGAGGMGGGGSNNKTVKLTAEQVRVAKGFGITPEEYAKQLISPN